jgi:hypothetical protein
MMKMKALRLLALTLLALLSCGQPSAAPVDAAPVADDSASPPAPQDVGPVVHRRPATAFAPASPDTRSPAQLVHDACTGADGVTWLCDKKLKPKTFAASSPGSVPIIPFTWTVPNWYVNKSTGSDANACTTSGSPCATKQEIWVHRFGCGGAPYDCPRFRQTTTLEQDASDTDNSDPLYAHVALEAGASFIVKGGAGSPTAAVFTRSAQKSRAAGSNSLLAGSFSAGGPAVGVLVTNTTGGKSSKAWVYATAGGSNWSLTQPTVPNTPVTVLSGVEVDTWASTDTVTLAVPIAVNISDISATATDYNGTFTNAFYLYNLTIYDPAAQADVIAVGNNVYMQEVFSQRFLSFYDGTQTAVNQRVCINLFSNQSLQANGGPTVDPEFIGGALAGASGNIFVGDPLFSGDIILGGGGGFTQLQIGGDTHDTGLGGAGTNGSVYLDGPFNVISSRFQVASAGAVIYGSASGQINLIGSAHLQNSISATFVQRFTAPSLVSPGITLNGASTGHSVNTTAHVDTYCGAIATTPAALDAAATTTCGTTGFGGNAFNPGGASVSNF